MGYRLIPSGMLDIIHLFNTNYTCAMQPNIPLSNSTISDTYKCDNITCSDCVLHSSNPSRIHDMDNLRFFGRQAINSSDYTLLISFYGLTYSFQKINNSWMYSTATRHCVIQAKGCGSSPNNTHSYGSVLNNTQLTYESVIHKELLKSKNLIFRMFNGPVINMWQDNRNLHEWYYMDVEDYPDDSKWNLTSCYRMKGLI